METALLHCEDPIGPVHVNANQEPEHQYNLEDGEHSAIECLVDGPRDATVLDEHILEVHIPE